MYRIEDEILRMLQSRYFLNIGQQDKSMSSILREEELSDIFMSLINNMIKDVEAEIHRYDDPFLP